MSLIILLFSATPALLSAADAPAGNKTPQIPIATIQHPGPVDFEKEILPIFSNSCLACHNKTKAKSGFVLETPADIRKGGEDASVAVIPGKGAESLLVQAASHDPKCDAPMPPPNNKVAAVDLTPEQLGLIKLWIDQGATGEVRGSLAEVKWQAMPAQLDPIYAVAITPNGRFAACGRANRIDVYDLPGGKLAASLVDPQLASSGAAAAHRDMVESLAFSPDGTTLASGSFREVKLWRRSSAGEKSALGDKAATCVVSSPDGKRIATAGEDGTIRLWDSATGKSAGELSGHTAAVISLQFSPDGGKLLSLSKDKSVRVWDVVTGKEFCKVETRDGVRCAGWVGSKSVAAGSADGSVVAWTLPADADGAMTVGKAFKEAGPAVTAIIGIPGDESHLLFARQDGGVFRASIGSGSLHPVLKTGTGISAMLIRPDGKRLVILGDDNIARIWTIDDAKMVAELKGDPVAAAAIAAAERALNLAKNEVTYRKNRVEAAEKQVTTAADRSKRAKEALTTAETALADAQKALDVAKSAADAVKPADNDDKEAAAKKSDKREAITKDFDKATEGLKKAQRAKDAAGDEVKLAARDEQDSAAALADARPTADAAGERVKLREKDVGDAKAAMTTGVKPLRAITLSADGAMVATAGDDGDVHTWNCERGTAGEVYSGGGGALVSVALVGRDRLVICPGGAPPAVLTPSTTWKLDRTIASGDSLTPFADRVTSIDFSPDGKLLATGGGVPSRSGEIRIFDLATGNLKNAFDNIHSDTVLCVRFSPDGGRLASGSADRMVRLIDPANGKILRTLEGHAGHALSVAWSHDGHTLASTGSDNTLRFWDAETGDRRKPVEGFDKEVTSVTFVGDDAQAVTCSGDGKVRLVKDSGGDVRSYPGATDFLYSIAASTDGATIIAGGQDGVLRAWDAAKGQPSGTYGADETWHASK